jgi:hypothetical protein
MLRPNHHHVLTVALNALRPTQASVGYVEVSEKRQEWQSLKSAQQQYYIVDHHHLGLALHEEGVESVFLTLLADYSWLDVERFWRVMEFHQWVHPYNTQGQRIGFHQLPVQVSALKDDPYRSLAGMVRKAGGYAKDVTPFAEFLWGDYFRNALPVVVTDSTLRQHFNTALTLARDPLARYLPGWTG